MNIIRLFGIAMVATLPLMAQDFLKPLVVSADRIGVEASESAYSVAVFDSGFLADHTRRTLPEVLQLTPGVLVQKTAHGHGSPFIRGFTGRQNLLLVDGVRINNSTFRSGPIQYWNTVDPLALDRIELVRSQGSVLYGSDAAGGTLTAYSKSSDFRARPDGVVYGNGAASYEFRTNGQGSHIGRVELESGVGGHFGVWLGLSGKDFGDIRDSSVGRMRGTGHPEQSVDFRVDFATGADSTLTLAHQYLNQDDISRWHRTLNNPGWTKNGSVAAPGAWNANTYDQERSLTYLRHVGRNERRDAAIRSWSATVSYQDITDSEFQDRLPAGGTSIRRSNIDVRTLGADLTLESEIGPGTLVYGFDFYRDRVDASGSTNNVAGTNFLESLPVADDSTYDLFGLYTQYRWNIGERIEITPGVRYTHASAELGRFTDALGATRTNESQSWDAVVGSLRGLYRIDDAWGVFGGISQAFRAPNLVDLSGNLSTRAGGTVLGSTDLEPEKFLTYELGLRHTSDTLTFQGGVFYTDVNDVITDVREAPPSTARVTTNGAGGYVYGIELESAWRFHPQWTLSGFAAWQDARVEAPDFVGGSVNSRPQSRQLPLSGSFALRWTSESGAYWAEGRVTGAAREDRTTAADQAADNQRIPTNGTPSYVVASLRGGWQLNDHLALTAAVENLTDTDHRIHGSGQNEPGLNFILGARVNW
ncbi:MAG: TonB-dependent receptor plug domain-containing protein [Luteolibacter sp.]